jgi:uncharacterized protein (TIGR02145 family)
MANNVKDKFMKTRLIMLGLLAIMAVGCGEKENPDYSGNNGGGTNNGGQNNGGGGEEDEGEEPVEPGVLINGVRWAETNVDKPGEFAAKSTDAGMFYQWNRPLGWTSKDPLTPSDGSSEWDSTILEGDTWERENDPCPEGWRVPTIGEFEALCTPSKVTSEWVAVSPESPVAGRKFTDKETGGSIFLPAVSCRLGLAPGGGGGTLHEPGLGKYGYYWSSSPEQGTTMALFLFFGSGEMTGEYQVRIQAYSVRCVVENS